MGDLDLLRLDALLDTAWVGRTVRYWPRIGSTMEEARRWAEEGAPSGALAIADEQVTGRGRLARSWWPPPCTSLLLTVVLRPDLPPRQAQRLTMACSLAVCDAIAAATGLEPRVKWPNDVLIGGRKVCGILTELGLEGDRLDYALVGIGINVNVDLATAPPLMAPATSLRAETGGHVSRLEVLAVLLSSLERRCDALARGHSTHEEWARCLATIGERVSVLDGDQQWRGVACGVDEEGALLLRLQDGAIRRIVAGDVTLRDGT